MKKNTDYPNYDKKNLKERFLEDDNLEEKLRNLKKDEVYI